MERIGLRLMLGYLLVLSLVLFCIMGSDKHRAKKGAWRIPEKTLFLTALLGGAIGGTAGMWCFHHKTRHWYFRYGFPLIALLQLAGIGFLAYQNRF